MNFIIQSIAFLAGILALIFFAGVFATIIGAVVVIVAIFFIAHALGVPVTVTETGSDGTKKVSKYVRWKRVS